MANIIYYNGDYKPLAQKLRREMTRQEKHLWYDFLKSYVPAFRRQKQFGPYIVDFYCAKAMLVIELDGSQRFEQEGMQNDEQRDQYLIQQGLNVMRFSNHDIDCHFDAVCTLIDSTVRE